MHSHLLHTQIINNTIRACAQEAKHFNCENVKWMYNNSKLLFIVVNN